LIMLLNQHRLTPNESSLLKHRSDLPDTFDVSTFWTVGAGAGGPTGAGVLVSCGLGTFVASTGPEAESGCIFGLAGMKVCVKGGAIDSPGMKV
jgi:hypothetical protein